MHLLITYSIISTSSINVMSNHLYLSNYPFTIITIVSNLLVLHYSLFNSLKENGEFLIIIFLLFSMLLVNSCMNYFWILSILNYLYSYYLITFNLVVSMYSIPNLYINSFYFSHFIISENLNFISLHIYI